MDVLSNLSDRVLTGTVLTIETALFPTITIDLGAETTGGGVDPSPVVEVLRPRVTMVRDGVTLLRKEPAGAPEDAPPWALIAAAATLAMLLWFVFKK